MPDPYTQHPDEERAILEIFEGFTGRALDVGAWVATTFSNTRALYEHGWSLVLVEPSPLPFYYLLKSCTQCGNAPSCSCQDRKVYGYDERVILIHAAVSRERTLLRMHASDDALSTAHDPLAAEWGDSGGYYGRFWIPTLTVNDIGNQFGPFDFISIDVEGMNREVFFSVPLEEMRPKAVCVEHSGKDLIEVQAHAHSLNYVTYYINGGNVIFVAGEWLGRKR